jgi:GNAT superfamily N-acetyltransferase
LRVAEDFRRRWTATRPLEQLAAIAAERGIRRFDAAVLAVNRSALGVFTEAGFKVQRKGVGGEITLMLDITPTETCGSGSTSATARAWWRQCDRFSPHVRWRSWAHRRTLAIPARLSCQTWSTAMFKPWRCQSKERAV